MTFSSIQEIVEYPWQLGDTKAIRAAQRFIKDPARHPEDRAEALRIVMERVFGMSRAEGLNDLDVLKEYEKEE